jgi:hypothetical protein
VDLQTRKLGNLERFLEQRTDVVEVREKTFSVFISFPAMSLVPIKAKSVVTAFCFLTRFRDELLAKFLERFQVTTGYLKVRRKSTAFI